MSRNHMPFIHEYLAFPHENSNQIGSLIITTHLTKDITVSIILNCIYTLEDGSDGKLILNTFFKQCKEQWNSENKSKSINWNQKPNFWNIKEVTFLWSHTKIRQMHLKINPKHLPNQNLPFNSLVTLLSFFYYLQGHVI